jgi:PhzF family phenazine biosynthesis protein
MVEGLIELDFPVNPLESTTPPPGLVEALGVEPVFVGSYPNAYLVVTDSEAAVRALDPDLTVLARLPRPKVCVSALSSTDAADFVARLFAPALGVPEDPVNGNSHTVLAPYWAKVTGRQSMISHYVSERGGEVRVRLAADRVKIAGRAVTVMRGMLEH